MPEPEDFTHSYHHDVDAEVPWAGNPYETDPYYPNPYL